jgi:hypothetical protein
MEWHVYCAIAVLALLAVGSDGARGNRPSSALTDAYPFYHTSDELSSEAKALETGGCTGLRVTFEKAGAWNVPVAQLSGLGQMKTMLVFGVHGRELISAETGLAFLRRLCSPEAASLRQQSSFLIVLNGNPGGRRKVEDGQFCFRTNSNNVDINRNYGYKWEERSIETISGPQSHGSKPFSEPETRIIAKLLKEWKPELFIDVHSGVNSLLSPFGWTWDSIPEDAQSRALSDVSKVVAKKHCPACTEGAAAQDLGYRAPGSSLDYAWSLGVRFPYTWEIYDSTQHVAGTQHATSLVAKPSAHRAQLLHNCSDGAAAHPVASFLSRRSALTNTRSCLDPEVRAMKFMNTEAERRTCMTEFNPHTEIEFNANIARWCDALFTVTRVVRTHLFGTSVWVTEVPALL